MINEINNLAYYCSLLTHCETTIIKMHCTKSLTRTDDISTCCILYTYTGAVSATMCRSWVSAILPSVCYTPSTRDATGLPRTKVCPPSINYKIINKVYSEIPRPLQYYQEQSIIRNTFINKKFNNV